MTKPRQFRLEDDTLRKIDELAAIIIDCVWLRVNTVGQVLRINNTGSAWVHNPKNAPLVVLTLNTLGRRV